MAGTSAGELLELVVPDEHLLVCGPNLVPDSSSIRCRLRFAEELRLFHSDDALQAHGPRVETLTNFQLRRVLPESELVGHVLLHEHGVERFTDRGVGAGHEARVVRLDAFSAGSIGVHWHSHRRLNAVYGFRDGVLLQSCSISIIELADLCDAELVIAFN